VPRRTTPSYYSRPRYRRRGSSRKVVLPCRHYRLRSFTRARALPRVSIAARIRKAGRNLTAPLIQSPNPNNLLSTGSVHPCRAVDRAKTAQGGTSKESADAGQLTKTSHPVKTRARVLRNANKQKDNRDMTASTVRRISQPDARSSARDRGAELNKKNVVALPPLPPKGQPDMTASTARRISQPDARSSARDRCRRAQQEKRRCPAATAACAAPSAQALPRVSFAARIRKTGRSPTAPLSPPQPWESSTKDAAGTPPLPLAQLHPRKSTVASLLRGQNPEDRSKSDRTAGAVSSAQALNKRPWPSRRHHRLRSSTRASQKRRS
jgi:hypothetical protein